MPALLFGHWFERLGQRWTHRRPSKAQLIQRYLANDRKPWSPGYSQFKSQFVSTVVSNPELLDVFDTGARLPPGYGPRLDERVVEFPWTLARLRHCGQRAFDAGSTLNHHYLLKHPILAQRELVIMTLAPECQVPSASISYLYGDLRSTIVRDNSIDVIACISTLEHIGMDNTVHYTADPKYRERSIDSYREALVEFRRILKPGGTLLVTVPFGKRQQHGWAQQFDIEGIGDIVAAFDGKLVEQRFYRYLPDGWVLSDAVACAQCEYFDVHATPEFDSDYAAAARAVACLEMLRP